jgi:uncharacterized protein YndB with AHSA1/START domain
MKKISIITVVIIATILVLAAFKPDEFRVERSITIKAPPEKIFPLVNDLHAFSTWSPYEKMDPAMKRSYSGPASGVGAAYEWEGNNNVGHGRMEITNSSAPDNVLIQLDFYDPIEAHNTAAFTLKPEGSATTVTWAMFGPAPFRAKLMSLFFSMDNMVGTQFEEGLENLKQQAEK